ncbi:hypothetical protein [Novosphingopyxis sp.]|uniref:hypothetical protein n=1 Tax=Novosphingopyxis sp. TaxID=2709690 RepID=UPI003B59DEB6
MIRSLIALAALPLAACAAGTPAGPASPYAVQQRLQQEASSASAARRTTVGDQAALDRLRNNSGLTLQWIGWDYRGTLNVTQDGALVRLHGSQNGGNAPPGTKDAAAGRLTLDGAVTDIASDHFSFDGTITIADAPDAGRNCVRTGPMLFQVTQNRKYWRLQNMESCRDGLTDYVDIYF